MFLRIKKVLNDAETARLRQLAQGITFIDGRASNPASQVKQNLQADPSDALSAESSQLVRTALLRSRAFNDFALPKRMAPPLLCRYAPGMKYGAHADSALIAVGGAQMRSDVSCTVFLGDPASYEGGELAITLGNQTVAFKSEPGDAILYPSTMLHEVVPVRSGERLVAITFVESLVADPMKRLQVYELNEIAALEGLRMNPESRARLDVVRQNLLRMWSST